MERMEYVKLGDIVSHKKGFAFSSSDYKKEGTMVVRVSDFTLDSIGKNEAVFIENKFLKYFVGFQLFCTYIYYERPNLRRKIFYDR